MLSLFRFEFSNIFTLEKAFGMSIRISLNSLTKGGKTRIKIEAIVKDENVITKNKDKDLGIFNDFCI